MVLRLSGTCEATSLPLASRLRTPEALAAAHLSPEAVILGAGSPSVGAIAVGKAAASF